MDDYNQFRLLPELLEIILTKAALVQMHSKDTVKRQSDEYIFNSLASVDCRWWYSMKKYNTKNKVRHLSKVYFQRTKMRSTIIRNNRNFLKEVIDPDKIIFPLESCGCLTEDQAAFLARLRNHMDKNHEILFMLQNFSSQKYSKMIDCLFLANQTPAALVLERGGKAVKVSINNGNARRTREIEMEFIERYQQMQTETMLMLDDLLNNSVEKLLNDVCILHARQNKGIEFWFWCKTETSLNRLKGLSDDDLQEIILRIYKRLIPEHSIYLKSQCIQMDYSLANDVAERRLSLRHVGDHSNLIGFVDDVLRFPEFSNYVTSLADKIYIVQKGKILAYENKYPYHATEPIVDLLDREDLGLSLPVSITSCNTNKCLYISFARSSIFKVEPEFENRVSEWLNRTETETNLLVLSISVTRKGDVLVFELDNGSNILLIFTPEGMIKRTISMEKSLGQALFIQEIMPDIVAFRYAPRGIAIMRLDDNGTILRRIECQQTIDALSSFRCGDLLFVVHRYIHGTMRGNSSDFVSVTLDKYHIDSQLGNYEEEDDDDDYGSRIVQLHHRALESKVARNLLTIDEMISGIHFAADQKQFYVLKKKNLHIYQLNYEDEDCYP